MSLERDGNGICGPSRNAISRRAERHLRKESAHVASSIICNSCNAEGHKSPDYPQNRVSGKGRRRQLCDERGGGGKGGGSNSGRNYNGGKSGWKSNLAEEVLLAAECVSVVTLLATKPITARMRKKL